MDKIEASPRIEEQATSTNLRDVRFGELLVQRFSDKRASLRAALPPLVNHAQLLGREDS